MRFYSQFLQCPGTNIRKSVFIWLNEYSFANLLLPHFPVSIIRAYWKLLKGFLLHTLNVFLLDGIQILNFFCLINISCFWWQKSIYFSFLSHPGLVEWINFNFYFHISFCYLKRFYEGLNFKKKRENENWSWFLFWQFFFLKYKGQWTLTNLFLRSKKTLYIDTIQSLTGTNIGLIWQLCADSSDFLLWVPK